MTGEEAANVQRVEPDQRYRAAALVADGADAAALTVKFEVDGDALAVAGALHELERA